MVVSFHFPFQRRKRIAFLRVAAAKLARVAVLITIAQGDVSDKYVLEI